LEVLRGIGWVRVLVFFGVNVESFCEKIFRVWMDQHVERHERVSDEGSGEAKAESLFAAWICAPPADALKKEKANEDDEKQTIIVDDCCA
jgi:hypothetical protein